MLSKHSFSKLFVLLYSFFVVTACGKKETNGEIAKVFELLKPSTTGIDFTNIVPENDSLNQYTYHYLYNGNGVAAGDLNNDGLVDLIFTGNAIPAKVYLNKGEFKFEDITAKCGVKTSGWMSGISMADVNNDGFLDVYICRSGPEKSNDAKRNYLFINNGKLGFTEEAAKWGVDDPGNATCATFWDYDADGDLDIYLGNHADRFFSDINVPFTRNMHMDEHNQQHLFRNDGGKYTDVSEESGMKAMGYCLSASPGDFNKDGWEDIYVCNDYHIPDYYYINNGDGTFTESFKTYFKHSSTNSMGSDVCDYNNDGWLDIFTADMLSEDPRRFMLLAGPKDYDYFSLALHNNYGYQYIHNDLQTNKGKGYFSDLAFLNGVARTDWSWSPLFADFNNDGLSDLYVSNGYYRDVTNQDFAFYQDRKIKNENKGATYQDIIDKLPFEKLPNYMYKNNGNYSFTNMAADWGLEEATLSTGAAYADLNNDGKLQIILCNQGDPISIYKNIGATNNYIDIQCKGGKKNNYYGIGCKLFVSNDTTTRVYEMQQAHGFQSSSELKIHVGLGNAKKANKVVVVWPNGEFQELKDIKTGERLILDEKNASGKYNYTIKDEFTFTEITELIDLNYTHEEGENSDFKREPLLPHRFTRLGPGACTGDVNGDDLVDILITNARGGTGSVLFLQNANGKFTKSASQPWKIMSDVDALGCLIFDSDKDGDNDIYIVAGGAEYQWPSTKYVHRIFTNDGKGNFTEKSDALPDVNCSGSCITAGDFNGDGYLDLFVAGRVTPGMYPSFLNRSYLLLNKNGKFVDVTATACRDLEKGGMVCSAVFTDFNNDNRLDLVLCGEWLPIAILENDGNKFINQTPVRGTGTFPGWYNSLIPIDIDNDGDLDYIAGNKGLNSYVQATADNPLKIYWADIDGNGKEDIWLTYTRNGRELPLYQLDEMAMAYPGFIRKRFTTYEDIANKTAVEIFGEENMKKNQMRANLFASALFKNNGGAFEMIELPRLAQAQPIYGMHMVDLDGNGYLDIMCIGNSNSPRVQHGRDDAGNGFVLYNDGKTLKYSDGMSNGFIVPGDGKALVGLPIKNQEMCFVATQNDGPAKAFSVVGKRKFYKAIKNETRAMIHFANGKVRMDNMTYGYGYLSGSAPGVWAEKNITFIEFIDPYGKVRKVVPKI